jgi:phosphodiesterase/alkaline phosphatase D-like protein
MSGNMNRRKFLATTAAAAGGLLIARFSHAQEILSEDDGTAVAMGYAADHTTVDTSVWTKKAGPDGDNQKCTTCALYQKQDEDYGLCPIFAGKRVHANGWCNGWVPK